MVICLERGADLHIAQPMPLTVSCSSKIQSDFTFVVPTHLGSPGQRAVKWVCVCVTDMLTHVNFILLLWQADTHTHTQPFNGCFSETTWVSRYQKGKTNMDFSEARDSKWQWHQLGHMQVCTSLQRDNHTSTPPLGFFTGRVPFLPPNQQHQTTEGNKAIWMQLLYGEYWFKFTH